MIVVPYIRARRGDTINRIYKKYPVSFQGYRALTVTCKFQIAYASCGQSIINVKPIEEHSDDLSINMTPFRAKPDILLNNNIRYIILTGIALFYKMKDGSEVFLRYSPYRQYYPNIAAIVGFKTILFPRPTIGTDQNLRQRP